MAQSGELNRYALLRVELSSIIEEKKTREERTNKSAREVLDYVTLLVDETPRTCENFSREIRLDANRLV
jgi:hypothetical protein